MAFYCQGNITKMWKKNTIKFERFQLLYLATKKKCYRNVLLTFVMETFFLGYF